MSKKLRDAACVNDLVLYRNACEEKKLHFTITQLQNLKEIYSRQKEQEKMYFAVQHMAVPVRTGSVITNLRRQLEELQQKRRCRSESLSKSIQSPGDLEFTGSGRKSTVRHSLTDENSPTSVLSAVAAVNRSESETVNVKQVSSATTQERSTSVKIKQIISENVQDGNRTVKIKMTADNIKSRHRASRRIISPLPKRVDEFKQDTHRKGILQNSGDLKLPTRSKHTKSQTAEGIEQDIHRKSIFHNPDGPRSKTRKSIFYNPSERISNPTVASKTHETSSIQLDKNICEKTKTDSLVGSNGDGKYLEKNIDCKSARSNSTWNSDSMVSKRNKNAPRLQDLPPVTFNMYEVPRNEKESREKWKETVDSIRNSFIGETRSEEDVYKDNQEIRKKWVTSYEDMKRERITSMMKDNLRVGDGEELTLVKFLPKSRQSRFIKEAQYNHVP